MRAGTNEPIIPDIWRSYNPLGDDSEQLRTVRVADGVGFEPTRSLHPCRFSRPVPSTARPPIQINDLHSAELLYFCLCARNCARNLLTPCCLRRHPSINAGVYRLTQHA